MSESFVLWYHDPNSSDYSLSSYIRIMEISNVNDFWSSTEAISPEAWNSGMFFFMRRGFKPLWDVPENEAGGAWSKKIEASEAYTVFIDLMVHCILNDLLSLRKETLVGITISPKGPFSIIKVWNTTTTVSDNGYINPKIDNFKIGDDVTYTAHKARPK